MRVGLVTFLVRDYDEAVNWFVDALGFELLEDTDQGGGKRWVVVCPPGGAGTALLLARASSGAQVARIGDHTGGRVAFFLHAPEFQSQHARMTTAGVRFLEEPRYEPYGWVAVFEDLYGNRWDLLEDRAG